MSQGNVKTLFRWGGKRLHSFVAKLFATQCNKLYQYQPKSVEDMANIMGYFFLRHVVDAVLSYRWHAPFLLEPYGHEQRCWYPFHRHQPNYQGGTRSVLQSKYSSHSRILRSWQNYPSLRSSLSPPLFPSLQQSSLVSRPQVAVTAWHNVCKNSQNYQ